MANGSSHERIRPFIATIIVIFVFALIYCILFRETQPLTRDLLLLIVGSLITQLVQVTSYYFGSSKGSEDKTKIMGESIPMILDYPALISSKPSSSLNSTQSSSSNNSSGG